VFGELDLDRERIKSISSGIDCCAVVTESGKVFTWGSNENGQLGLPDIETQSISEPMQLRGPIENADIEHVQLKSEHCIATNRLFSSSPLLAHAFLSLFSFLMTMRTTTK